MHSLTKRKSSYIAKRHYNQHVCFETDLVAAILKEKGNRIKVHVTSNTIVDGFVVIRFTISPNTDMVESTNMLSGQKVMIRACDKGGCCDPASETYWSM